MEIENAKITNVSISMADHGVLTFSLTLEGGDWGVCVGDYVIGHGYLGAEEFTAENGSGLVAMMKIMDTVGVETWEDLKGQYIRVKTEGYWSPVHIIGNLLKDKWFDFEEFFSTYKGE